MTMRILACYVPRSQRYRFVVGQYRPDGVVIGLKKEDMQRMRWGHILTNSQHSKAYNDYLEFWRALKKVYDGEVLD